MLKQLWTALKARVDPDRHDEPDRDGSAILPGYTWLGKVHPLDPPVRRKLMEFRVVLVDDYYGLEVLRGESWEPLMAFDNGYDDYGKLHRGRWRPVGQMCRWSQEGLQRLARDIRGEAPNVEVVWESVEAHANH